MVPVDTQTPPHKYHRPDQRSVAEEHTNKPYTSVNATRRCKHPGAYCGTRSMTEEECLSSKTLLAELQDQQLRSHWQMYALVSNYRPQTKQRSNSDRRTPRTSKPRLAPFHASTNLSRTQWSTGILLVMSTRPQTKSPARKKNKTPDSNLHPLTTTKLLYQVSQRVLHRKRSKASKRP